MNFIESLEIKVHCTKLFEAAILPPKAFSGLGKLREELPQFKGIEDINSFSDFCKSTGTRVSKKTFKAHELNPTQSHIDSDKVIDIVQNYTQSSPPIIDPLVVDKDGYIIDGHHRWSALMYMNPNIEIPCYQLNVKVKHILNNKVPRWQDTIGDDLFKESKESLVQNVRAFNDLKDIVKKLDTSRKLTILSNGVKYKEHSIVCKSRAFEFIEDGQKNGSWIYDESRDKEIFTNAIKAFLLYANGKIEGEDLGFYLSGEVGDGPTVESNSIDSWTNNLFNESKESSTSMLYDEISAIVPDNFEVIEVKHGNKLEIVSKSNPSKPLIKIQTNFDHGGTKLDVSISGKSPKIFPAKTFLSDDTFTVPEMRKYITDYLKNVKTESTDVDFSRDLTDPVDIFSSMKDKIIVKAASQTKFFVKKSSDRLVSILDKQGKVFVNLRQLSKSVSLEILFPNDDTPVVKVFNHWDPYYSIDIVNALTDVLLGVKKGMDSKEIKDRYKNELSGY